MVAPTLDTTLPAPSTSDADAPPPGRIGVVPSASMITGAALGVVWFWIPLTILSSPSHRSRRVIGFLLAGVVFVYLMRGVDRVERVRSEAVFGFGIPVPPRSCSPYTGFQRWAHQLWLDVSSARFWKAVAHHYLRMIYDLLATGIAFALLAFAFLGPAAAMAISRSDADAGLSFISPPLAWLLAVIALVAAVAILVFAPARRCARSTAGCCRRRRPPRCNTRSARSADAREGAVSSAQTERHRIERDLHDSVQPRLVSLAMTIGLAQTKLDTDLPAAKQADRRGPRRRQERTGRVAQRGTRHRPDHPADRGLDAALSSVVQRTETSGVPTTLNVHLPRRLPDEVEACRLLRRRRGADQRGQTRPRHARRWSPSGSTRRPTRCTSRCSTTASAARRHRRRRRDGPARPEERVRAARGTFAVSSPATGPTIVTAVLPCAS